MGNCPLSMRNGSPLPIETILSLSSPLPTWNSVGGFANGIIDLGGIEVCQVSTFTKIWATLEGGQDNQGATFFEPSQVPDGFSILGYYAQPNNKPLFGRVLVARDTTNENILAKPIDFTLIWSSQNANIKQSGNGYFWLPTPPDGYKVLGLVVTDTAEKPPVDDFRCVRNDFSDDVETDSSIWSHDKDGISVSTLIPSIRGVQALGVLVGTFLVQANGSPNKSTLACLKNNNSNFACHMPNLTQIDTLMQNFSPWIYLHPKEPYLPSSVDWFFKNGALLYQKDNQAPIQIESNGSNLPQAGSNDGLYWIDLPSNNSQSDMIKKGDIASAETYLHVKPMFGATCTDIAIWVFYPFNGPARAKVAFLTVPLGKIGEHVSDWEHLTLRISNFKGELISVYFSEHSGGSWFDASQLDYEGGNKPVTYASLHGHAFYSKPGLVLQGDSKSGIGIRNDSDKGQKLDIGNKFRVVSADYLEVIEPPWLNYMREWGPKISYDTRKEIEKVAKILPKKLRQKLENVIDSLPNEVLGEEGPTGPKVKNNWISDEK